MVESKLNIQVNFKGSQPQIQRIKKQDEDDHWISEEELYTEGSSDEEKSSHSTRKHNLKGIGLEEILIKDEDLREMKESIEKLEEVLAIGKFAEEIYDVGKLRSEIRKELRGHREYEKIAERMSEMKEFDKILKLKSEEIKMVRLERMRLAEESTRSLQELSKSDTSEAIKNNSEQFLRLLQNEVNDSSGRNVDAIKKVKPTRRDKAKAEELGRRSDTFIERNIKLAKCGDGILSLTDEEKLRLNTVLKDIEEKCDDRARSTEVYSPDNNQYVMDDETKKILNEIDKKLEEHEKTKLLLRSIKNLDLPKESPQDEELVKDEVKPKIYTLERNDLRRLREVDRLLNNLNSSTSEVIDPLLEEELQILIEESKQSLSLSFCEDQEARNNIDSQVPFKETMLELVTTARNNMPNFKFRCE